MALHSEGRRLVLLCPTYLTYLQGGLSGCTLQFVDVKTKVRSHLSSYQTTIVNLMSTRCFVKPDEPRCTSFFPSSKVTSKLHVHLIHFAQAAAAKKRSSFTHSSFLILPAASAAANLQPTCFFSQKFRKKRNRRRRFSDRRPQSSLFRAKKTTTVNIGEKSIHWEITTTWATQEISPISAVPLT